MTQFGRALADLDIEIQIEAERTARLVKMVRICAFPVFGFDRRFYETALRDVFAIKRENEHGRPYG